eukprot:6181140-Pleurochrysis_carterae.AAC.1
MSMIATARASACTRGRVTARSASGTDAFTPSEPPKLDTTSRGCSIQGTDGRWRTGPPPTPPVDLRPRLPPQLLPAAPAPDDGRKVRTVSSSQSARGSTPPPHTCSTMSVSAHASRCAPSLSVSRSIWRGPGKAVARGERVTGAQRSGSEQSQTMPLAHGCRESWPRTRVGTCGTSTSAPPPGRLARPPPRPQARATTAPSSRTRPEGRAAR